MNYIIAILVFGLLIFVHELGHFVVAKLSGITVLQFTIGFGPAIFKKQVGETLYAVRLLPLGGYCSMEGEDQESEDPRAFSCAAGWKRFIILIAGSLANFLIGLIIVLCLFGGIRSLCGDLLKQSAVRCLHVRILFFFFL